MPVQSAENGRENITKPKYGYWDINEKRKELNRKKKLKEAISLSYKGDLNKIEDNVFLMFFFFFFFFT